MLYYNSHLDCLPEQVYLKAARASPTVRFGSSWISPFLGWRQEIIAILFCWSIRFLTDAEACAFR